MSTREQTTIIQARYGVEPDHGILVLEICCDFGGAGQAFQACVAEKLGPAMVREVCDLFGITKVEQLVGRQCFALRSFPYWSEQIEGFEADGRRWTKTGCVRRHAPEHARNPLETREEEKRAHIVALAEDVQRLTNDLRKLRSDFVDWETSDLPTVSKGDGKGEASSCLARGASAVRVTAPPTGGETR